MSKKENFKEQDQELENIQNALSGAESFIEKNSKVLSIALGAIVLIVAAWLLIENFVIAPKNQAADEAIAMGQKYFEVGMYDVALNGDSVEFDGFLALNDEYSSTKSGKLAGVYAGLSYYKLGDYDKAIEYLKDYSGSDEVLKYTVLGTIGDCYSQKGETENAIKYFLKAANSNNILVAPVYKVKAGVAYEKLGEYDKAIDLYNEVKEKATAEQRGIPEVDDIDKYIASASAKNGK